MNSPVEPAVKKGGVIIAAGGIVERGENDKKEILIIYRERHGSEWCLPKGKQKAQESIEETALREVKEETYCSAKITGFAKPVHYPVDENMKVVFFWRMKVEKEEAFKESEEVKAIQWLHPIKAWEQLSHENEKNLIFKLFIKSNTPKSTTEKLRSWFNNEWQSLTQIQSSERLRRDLATYSQVLNHRISEIKPGENPKWAVSALNLLEEAYRSLEVNLPSQGWACFHAARRMEILGMDSVELEKLAKIIIGETPKLTKWRRETIHALIGNGKEEAESPDSAKMLAEGKEEVESPDSAKKLAKGKEEAESPDPAKKLANRTVWWAAQLRDEHFDNQYLKIDIRRNNLIWVLIFLLSTIFLMFLFEILGLLPSSNRSMLIASAFLGTLGALLSVALTLSKSSIDQDIPDQILGSFVTWMRPVIGAVSGMVTYIFIKAGLLTGFVAENLTQGVGILALAFVSGFSERFIVRAIDKVAETKDAKN